MGVAVRMLSSLIDTWALQLDANTWNRYRLVRPQLLAGPIVALNIGTGGMETLRLLKLGSSVTTIEIERLILSTPTASHGMLPGDTISVAVGDGGHVRAGYDGPDLDRMPAEVGFRTGRRILPGMLVRDNVDKPHGADTRVTGGSAVAIDQRPFSCTVEEVLRSTVCEPLVSAGESIRTFLLRGDEPTRARSW